MRTRTQLAAFAAFSLAAPRAWAEPDSAVAEASAVRSAEPTSPSAPSAGDDHQAPSPSPSEPAQPGAAPQAGGGVSSPRGEQSTTGPAAGAVPADRIPEARPEVDPVTRFRRFSVGILAGANSTWIGAAGTTSGIARFDGVRSVARVNLGGNARVTYQSVLFDVRGSCGFSTGTDTFLGVGAGVGYILPVSSRIALAPIARAEGSFDTGDDSHLGAVLGEMAGQYFLGEHGYIELTAHAGLAWLNGIGAGAVGGGYRVGVTF